MQLLYVLVIRNFLSRLILILLTYTFPLSFYSLLVSDWLHVSLLTKILTLKFSRMLPNFHNNWETLLALLNAGNKSQQNLYFTKDIPDHNAKNK